MTDIEFYKFYLQEDEWEHVSLIAKRMNAVNHG